MPENFLVCMPSTRPPSSTGTVSCRHLRILGVLALAILLAGCSGILADEQALPEPDEAADQYDSLDAYSATFTVERTMGNETEQWEGEIVARPGTGEIYQNVSRNGKQPIVFVSNGSVRWVFDTANESVTRVNGTAGESPRRQRIEQVVGRVTGGTNRTVQPGIPTAPVVPSGESPPGESIDASLTEARYEGIEAVGERRAHVIVVETTPDADFEYRRTLYLDTEWFVTLRGESERVVDGERHRSVFRLENITFNPDIADDRFEFDPPEDSSVNTTHFDRARYETRGELADVASLSVPDPAVPDRFELVHAQRSVSENVTSLSLRYSSATTTLFVSKRPVPGAQNLTSDGESVEIGNQTGVYREIGAGGLLEWTCDGSRYVVSGQLPKETLVHVAESVECE